jgi:hypothetical protein
MRRRPGSDAIQADRSEVPRAFLVYAENGMRLVYAGEDEQAFSESCARLSATSVGVISGYQFVGRQRYELRAYFDYEPSQAFLASRSRGQLFDFSWRRLREPD